MIYWYIRNKGNSPTFEEIKKFIKFASIRRLEHYLNEMDKRGWIIFNTGKHRSIVLLNHKKLTELMDEIDDIEIAEFTGFPLVEGTIAAGLPINHTLSPGYIHDTEDDTYTLKVKGDSMKGDHICDGDYVVIRKQDECVNGDIIVATQLLGDSTSSSTLKHFFKDEENNLIYLKSSIDPIIIPSDEWGKDDGWKIQGKLIKVIRWYGF